MPTGFQGSNCDHQTPSHPHPGLVDKELLDSGWKWPNAGHSENQVYLPPSQKTVLQLLCVWISLNQQVRNVKKTANCLTSSSGESQSADHREQWPLLRIQPKTCGVCVCVDMDAHTYAGKSLSVSLSIFRSHSVLGKRSRLKPGHQYCGISHLPTYTQSPCCCLTSDSCSPRWNDEKVVPHWKAPY